MNRSEREIRWFGESAILVRPFDGEDTHALARVLANLDRTEEVLPGSQILVRLSAGFEETVAAELRAIPFCELSTATVTRSVEIPVLFDGPDLEEIVRARNMSLAELVADLSAAELQVAYLGFAPGFAYVEGLPPSLSSIPRRSTPRTSVPAGSVGIAAGYLGIYPQTSPGGWNLIGRTDLVMFDPLVAPYSTVQPGDRIRIVSVSELSATEPTPRIDRPRCSSERRAVVESPGMMTTLQDRGRVGVGHLGVPKGGPADRDLMRLANLLVGNDPDLGVLETTLSGPTVRFDATAHVAVVGATVSLDGRPVEPGAVFVVPPGGRVKVDESYRLRAYIAVAGGLSGPGLFGSCSTDTLSGLGIGPLVAEDELSMGDPRRPGGYTSDLERNSQIRIVAGPDEFATRDNPELLRRFFEEPFVVTTESNRIGVRMERQEPSEIPLDRPTGLMRSYGMIEGAIQLPPSNDPIVLLTDHATMGGYPVVATVVSADVGAVAQKRPGETISFELVTLAEGRRAREAMNRQIRNAVNGSFPIGDVS